MRAFSRSTWGLLHTGFAGGARPVAGLDGEEEIGQSLRVWCWEGGIDFWKVKVGWTELISAARISYDRLISWLGNGPAHDFGVGRGETTGLMRRFAS